MEEITNQVGTTMGYFTKSRKRQPELDAAIVRGINNRHHAFSQKIQHSKRTLKVEAAIQSKSKKSKPKPKDQDSLLTRVSDDMSPEDALKRFYRLKAEEKKKRQLRELQNMD